MYFNCSYSYESLVSKFVFNTEENAPPSPFQLLIITRRYYTHKRNKTSFQYCNCFRSRCPRHKLQRHRRPHYSVSDTGIKPKSSWNNICLFPYFSDFVKMLVLITRRVNIETNSCPLTNHNLNELKQKLCPLLKDGM